MRQKNLVATKPELELRIATELSRCTTVLSTIMDATLPRITNYQHWEEADEIAISQNFDLQQRLLDGIVCTYPFHDEKPSFEPG